MSTTAPAPQRTRPSVKLFAAVLVVAVAVAVAAVLLVGGGSDKSSTKSVGVQFNGPAQAPFRLRVPKDWKRVSQSVVDRSGQSNTIAVQNPRGDAIVSVKANGKLSGQLKDVRKKLVSDLRAKLKNFKLSTSKIIRVKAGPALYTSWAGKSTVQTNLVVPVGDLTYTLNGVITAGDARAAAQVGAILRAFDAKQR